MKVVIITPYFHPVKGGITTYISCIAKAAMARKDVEVKIITMSGDRDKHVVPIGSWKLSFSSRALKVLKNERPDAIHAHSHWYALMPALRYKTMRPDTRVIFTFHTMPTRKMSGVKRRIFERMLSECDAVVFVSAAQKEWFEDNFSIRTVTKVISAGGLAGTRRYSPEILGALRKDLGIPDEGPIITYVGTFAWKDKVEGVKKLIMSMKGIRRTFPNAKLIIAGGGDLLDEVRVFSQEKAPGSAVIFTGPLDDIGPVLEIGDIYAHISFQEGLPLSLLEAMSAGKPVVTVKEGGIGEVVEDGFNGLMTGRTPDDIARTITELYRNKKMMTELGGNARKTIEERFSWEKAVEKYFVLYGIRK